MFIIKFDYLYNKLYFCNNFFFFEEIVQFCVILTLFSFALFVCVQCC